LSHHPLDDYAAYLTDAVNPVAAITPEADGKLVRVGGLITTVRKILTKKGDTMAFVGLEDKSGLTELIVFPKAYEMSPQVYEPDNIIMATGKIAARDREGRLTGEPKIIIDAAKIIDYETARSHKPLPDIKRTPVAARPAAVRPTPTPTPMPSPAGQPASETYLVLKLSNLSDQQLLHDIKEILNHHNGPADTFIIVGDDSASKKIRLPFKVTLSPGLVEELGALLGEGQVTRSA
jgi:DNA polymerase-3 subunit alpha